MLQQCVQRRLWYCADGEGRTGYYLRSENHYPVSKGCRNHMGPTWDSHFLAGPRYPYGIPPDSI